MSRIWSLSLLVTAILTGLSVTATGRDGSSEEAALADYEIALRKMVAFSSHIHASGIESKILRKPDGEVRAEARREYWVDGVNHMSGEVATVGPSRGFEWIDGSNPEYRFLLKRQDPSKPFVIDEYTPSSSNESPEIVAYPAQWDPGQTSATGYAGAAYSVFDMAMPRIIASPSFKLDKVTRLKEGDRDLVRFEFQFKPDKAYPIVKAMVLVQPSMNWAILSYEGGFGAKGNVKRSGTVEYGPPINGIPIPKRVVHEHPSYRYEFVFDSFDAISPGSESASRFRLSGYALPEIGSEAVEGSNRGFWLILLGSVLLPTAIAFMYYTHRGQRALPGSRSTARPSSV